MVRGKGIELEAGEGTSFPSTTTTSSAIGLSIPLAERRLDWPNCRGPSAFQKQAEEPSTISLMLFLFHSKSLQGSDLLLSIG